MPKISEFPAASSLDGSEEIPIVQAGANKIATITQIGLAAAIQGPAGPAGPAGAAGQGVPTGGTSGQVLAKNSSNNYDTLWTTPSSGTSFPTGNFGDVTNTGTSSSPTVVVNAGAITLAKQANLAALSVIGNIGGTSATPSAVALTSLKTAMAFTAADIAGNVIPVSASRNMATSDNGATLVWGGSFNVTVVSGLTGQNCICLPPSSGTATLTPASGVTINGSASAYTFTGTQPITLLATGVNTFLATSNTSSGGGVPTSTTLTVNRQTKDLSTNRTFTGGTLPIAFQASSASKTDANTTAATLFTFTLPANTMLPGDVLEIYITGTATNGATATKTFAMTIGGTQFAVNADSTSTTTSFEFVGRLTALSTGNQIGTQGYNWGGPGTQGNPAPLLTKDMTTALTVNVTAQWGTAGTGSNTLTFMPCRAQVVLGS